MMALAERHPIGKRYEESGSMGTGTGSMNKVRLPHQREELLNTQTNICIEGDNAVASQSDDGKKSSKDKARSLKELIHRAKVESTRPASKASRMLRFSPGSLYFLILEKDWWFCIVLALAIYGIPILILSAISLPLNFDNDTEEAELNYNGESPSQAALAFRFCAANVISMGFGTVFPTSNWGYFLATIQHLVGIMMNVFMFAAVLAKFQSPRGDIVFSKQLCFFNRDSVRHLAVRLGNLRCHTLFNPSIKLYFLTDHETLEGETFVKSEQLDITVPGTISGVYTITHRIDSESPLYKWKNEDFQKQVVAFQCIFSALDPVYKAEVCARATYNIKQMHFGCRFQDMMSTREDGRPVLDFASFEEMIFEPEVGLEMVSSPAPPMTSTPKICLVTGYGRSSYGDKLFDGDLPRSQLSPYCPFSLALAMILVEAGEDFDEFKADSLEKPDWLKDVNPKLQSPVCRLAGSTEWLASTDAIIDELIAHNDKVKQYSQIKPIKGKVISDSVLEDMRNINFIATALICAQAPKCDIRTFLLGKFQIDPNLNPDDCHKQLKEKGREILRSFELAFYESGKDYLCGDQPGLLDCQLVAKLYLFYNFVESGLANFGPLTSFPLTTKYLQTFAKRRSWRKAYGPDLNVGQLDLALLRTNCFRLANLMPTLRDSCIQILDKARRMSGSVVSRRSSLPRRSTTDRSNVASLCL